MILTILDGTGSGTSGGDNSRRRYLQIGLLALALLLVGVLGFRQVQRMLTPQREVWVASADLSPGTTIGAQNLRRVKIAENALPKGAVIDARAIAGRELSRAKSQGEPFVREDFAVGAEQFVAAAEMIPEGRVLTTVRVPKGLVPYKNLKNGDRVDLVSITGGRTRGSEQFASVVARDAYLVGRIQTIEQAPQAQPNGLAALVASSSNRQQSDPTIGLILALHPEDALPLAEAMQGRSRIQVVLHGKEEVASGQLLELPARMQVELIAGSTKSQLVVNP